MIRTALVGLGEIGRTAHLPALLRNSDVELVGIADPSPEQRHIALASIPGPPAVGASLDELLDVLAPSGVALDAVVLATPPWVTPALAVQAARRGLFVLAEKPVADSVAAAGIYEQLTPAEAARVQVGLTYRHDPAMQRLGQIIASGELGGPLLLRAHIYDEQRTTDAAHTALIERTLEHGSPVVHEGAHVFDWLAFLLGQDPVIDSAWSLRTRPALAAPNLVGAQLSYPSGTRAVVEFGWLTDALPRCEISVLGDAGYAVLDGVTFELTVTTSAGTVVHDFPGDRVERCFDRQFERFVALASGAATRAEPSLADGIAALTVSERVAVLSESSKKGL